MAHAISSSPRLPTFAYSTVIREPTFVGTPPSSTAHSWRDIVSLPGVVPSCQAMVAIVATLDCMAVPCPPPPDHTEAVSRRSLLLPTRRSFARQARQLVDPGNVPFFVTAWLPCETDDKTRWLGLPFAVQSDEPTSRVDF